MISILLLVYLFHTLGFASPLPIHRVATTPKYFERDLPKCECPSEQRTVWEILWSCLATTFTCTWVSLHPNIPDPDDSAWKVTKRRAGLMIWSILGPELAIFWAIRQWIGARKLADKFHEFNWTRTHGHFLQMGGFMLYNCDGERDCVLTGHLLAKLFTEGKIMFPMITEEEIQDRSKGDGLTKAIAIFQTTWFVAQCIARHAQGLVVTELEIITLAFAALNGLMYFFWWDKPLAVRYSVPVLLLQEPRVEQTLTEKEDQPKRSFWDQISKPICQTCAVCWHSCAEIFDALRYWEFGTSNTKLEWSLKAMLVFLFKPLALMCESMAKFCGDAAHYGGSYTRVGTHYAAEDLHNRSLVQLGIIVLVISNLFGAIHCIAWSFSFPSDTERILWHISSLIVLCVPELFFLNALMIIFEPFQYLPRPVRPAIEVSVVGLVRLLAATSIPIYATARLTLIVEAFVALRALTPAALLAEVEWSPFIPHI